MMCWVEGARDRAALAILYTQQLATWQYIKHWIDHSMLTGPGMPGSVEAAPISCMACASSAAVQAARWLWAASASAPRCSALLLASADLLMLPLLSGLSMLNLLLLETPLKVSGRLPCLGRAERELWGWDVSSGLISGLRYEPGPSPVLSSDC